MILTTVINNKYFFFHRNCLLTCKGKNRLEDINTSHKKVIDVLKLTRSNILPTHVVSKWQNHKGVDNLIVVGISNVLLRNSFIKNIREKGKEKKR